MVREGDEHRPCCLANSNDIDARGHVQTIDTRSLGERCSNETGGIGCAYGCVQNVAQVGTKIVNGTGQ